MQVAIYARSANVYEVILQIEKCKRYIADNWKPRTHIKLFAEIVGGAQNLENCAELQKLINESNTLDAIVVSHPLCFFPHIMDELIAIYKTVGGRKIHYALEDAKTPCTFLMIDGTN